MSFIFDWPEWDSGGNSNWFDWQPGWPYPNWQWTVTWPNTSTASQGWQCPFCKMVYAPTVLSCSCQTVPNMTTFSSTDINITDE